MRHVHLVHMLAALAVCACARLPGGAPSEDASAPSSQSDAAGQTRSDAAPPGVGDSDDVFGVDVPRADSYWVAGDRVYFGEHEIALRGINWFGLETHANALHGLSEGRSVDSFLEQVSGLGFTALRIPVARPSIQPGFGSADWANHGGVDTGREHLEELLALARARGLRVLLDIHTCDPAVEGGNAGGPEACPGYSRDDWLADLRTLAELAADYDNIVGVDLFNEPHALTWSAWRALAERGGEVVLRANPRILVFVEGVGGASFAGGFSPFWGENLALAGTEPVGLPASRLVYSPHAYGPGVFAQGYFNAAAFPANMPAIWDAHFGHLVGVPIALGEFGGHYTGADRVWHDALVDYMLARPIRYFFYWSLNPDSGDTGGLLEDDWRTVNADKLALLRRLGL